MDSERHRSRRAYLAALAATVGSGGCLGLEETATPTGARTGTPEPGTDAASPTSDGAEAESDEDTSDGSPPPGTRWTFEANGPFVAGPVHADGTVIATSIDRHVYAVDATGGDRQWAVESETELDNGPTVVGDTVVAAGLKEQVGVDIAGGTSTYQYNDPDLGVTVQTGGDDLVYQTRVVTGGVRAIDPLTGEVAWSDRTAKPTDSEDPNERGDAIASDGETVCVGVHPNSRIGRPPWGFAGYDAATGEQLWYVERDLDLDGISPEVAVSEGVCFAAVNNHYMSIDARSGSVMAEAEQSMTPVYGAVDGTVIVDRNGGLHGVDIATGETRWQSDDAPRGPTTLDGSTFWFVTDGTLYSADITSGSVRERQSLDVGNTSLTGDLAVTGETVFVTTEDATLRALERQ